MTRGPQQRVEHEVFDVPESKDELVKLLRKQEAAGWEFVGQANAGKIAQLVFKRPKGNPAGWAPQPGAGIPRLPVEPGQPMRVPVPQPPRFEPDRPRDPQPRGRGEDLPPARDRRIPPPDAGELPSESLLLEQTEPGAREATRTVYVKRPGPGGTFYYEPVTQKFRVPVGGEDEPQPRRGGGGDRLPPADAPIPPARNRDIPPVEADPVPFATPVIDLPPAGNAQRGEIHVIQLKNATPASMKNHISRFFEVDVSVDEDTGSLVIRCEKKTLEEIKKLVEQLDKPARGGA